MYEKSRRDTGKWGWKQCEVTTSIVSKFMMQKNRSKFGEITKLRSIFYFSLIDISISVSCRSF